jgi:arylsulfatase
MIRIPEANAPDIKNKSFHISADIEIPKGSAEGILATQGGRFGGWGLMVLDGKPMFAYALTNQDGAKHPNENRNKWRFGGNEKLTPGRHSIAFDFTYDGGGLGKGGEGALSVDGKKVAGGRIDKTIPVRFSLDESFDIGQDTGTPVIDEYDPKMPFAFTGTLRKVEFKLASEPLSPAQRAAMKRLREALEMAAQ